MSSKRAGDRYEFYFDPNTVLIAESTVEGMQTTIRQITAAPDSFAVTGWSNGLADHTWYVLGGFHRFREHSSSNDPCRFHRD